MRNAPSGVGGEDRRKTTPPALRALLTFRAGCGTLTLLPVRGAVARAGAGQGVAKR